MISKIINRFRFKQISIAFIVLAGLLGVQQILLHHINNYLIFSRSFLNLLEGNDLYVHYPNYYFDLYKYSPAFALLFVPLSIMPDDVGVILWNILNATIFVIALKQFFKEDRLCIYALLIVLFEAITSMQNLQSNCLLSGLIILTYTNIKKRNIFYAGLCVSLAAFIKIYGIAALAIAIFFNERFKFGFVSVLFLILLFFSPLLVINFDTLIFYYKSWIGIAGVPSISQMSVMGILQTWFGWTGSFTIIQLSGFLIVISPLIQVNKWRENYFQQLYLSSILMFVVLFNQMAESPTYIIPLTGVAIWFLSFEKASLMNIALLVFVLLLTSLAGTDLFPKYLRENFIQPYTLKAFPVLVVWIRLQFQLWFDTDSGKYRLIS